MSINDFEIITKLGKRTSIFGLTFF